jgi:hypothetical protein
MSSDSAVRLASGALWRELPNGDVELTVPEPSWTQIMRDHDHFAGIPERAPFPIGETVFCKIHGAGTILAVKDQSPSPLVTCQFGEYAADVYSHNLTWK